MCMDTAGDETAACDRTLRVTRHSTISTAIRTNVFEDGASHHRNVHIRPLLKSAHIETTEDNTQERR